MENFFQFTDHSLSARMQDAKLIKEQATSSRRELELEGLAKQYALEFSPASVSILNKHDFVYLRRGDDKQESNVMTGDYRGCDVKLFDYSHTAAPDYYAKHWHTLILLRCPPCENMLRDFVIAPGHYLARYLVEFDEIDMPKRVALPDAYRIYGREGSDAVPNIPAWLMDFLAAYDDFYIEVKNGVMLAFRRDHELLGAEDIALLFEFAESFRNFCSTQAKTD